MSTKAASKKRKPSTRKRKPAAHKKAVAHKKPTPRKKAAKKPRKKSSTTRPVKVLEHFYRKTEKRQKGLKKLIEDRGGSTSAQGKLF